MSLTLATIQVGKEKAEKVQFNPASLRVTTTNQIDDKHANQVSKPTAFKLDVELLFDSTEDGRDVYEKTRTIRFAAMASAKGATKTTTVTNSCGTTKVISKPKPSLSLVTFTWGTSIYKGYIESLNETLDYWSSDGVPLRSTIQISLKGTTDNFLTGTYGKIGNFGSNPVPALPEVVQTSAAQESQNDLLKPGLAAPADTAGSTGRGIAALNGLESMRGGIGAVAGAGFSAGAAAGVSAGAAAGAGFAAGASAEAGFAAGAGAGAGLAVGAGAQLQAAAGFAMSGGISAGASVGFGIGASAGLSAGAGLGASVGVGMAAGAGAGIGLGGGISAGAGFGMSAEAGFGMSAGAGIGISAGAGVGVSGGGIGISTSTSVTGFDGVTTTTTSSSTTGFDGVTRSSTTTSQSAGGFGGMGFGSASAGVTASAGAFAGLGTSRTTMPSAGFDLDSLLPPPLPAAGAGANFDVSGRLVGGEQQVATTWSHSSVTTW